MPGSAFLEGDRVVLRPVEPDDLTFVHDGVNHPAIRRGIGQVAPSNRPIEERWYEDANRDFDVIQLLIWADGERVGALDFDPIDREDGTAELGFWIHPDHRGQGYAREAVELAVDYAFAELRVHKVTADAYATNEGSRGLLESVGFTEEGVGREDAFLDGQYVDTHYYGLLADEWAGSE